MEKELSMEYVLGIAILIAAAGLFYLKFFHNTKIEKPKEDPVIVEMQNEIKELNDDVNELLRVRDAQTTANKMFRESIQTLTESHLKTVKEYEALNGNYKELYEKFKIANTTLLRVQASMLRSPSEMKVKFDGPILFKLEKPEVPAPPLTPQKGKKGIKPLFDKTQMKY